MAADMYEIHKYPQNTKKKKETLSVLWACTAPSLKTYHYKKAEGSSPFSPGCSECCAKEGLKGSGLKPGSPFVLLQRDLPGGQGNSG